MTDQLLLYLNTWIEQQPQLIQSRPHKYNAKTIFIKDTVDSWDVKLLISSSLVRRTYKVQKLQPIFSWGYFIF